MQTRSLLAAAALAALSLSVSAQNLKPGLWEVTSKTSGNPQMEQAMAEMQKQMASMPPAQRKQMEEAMARQGVKMGAASGGGMAMQMCMTKEMAEGTPAQMDPKSDCRITSQSRSGNTTKMAYTCANPPSSGEGTFTSNGPEAYTSKMVTRTTHQGKTETLTMEGSGKWLKADCGNIKPMQPPKK